MSSILHNAPKEQPAAHRALAFLATLRITRVKGLRWWIAAVLGLATIVNYLDRQLLSVVAPMLRVDLHLSNTQYAYAVDYFLTAYALMYAVGGWVVDRLQTRRGMALSLGIWSLASVCHSFIVGLWDLCLYRFLLGVSEPGCFTAEVKAVSTWFPVEERGVGIGIAVGGTSAGAIIAPPLTLWLALHYGWRTAFLLPSLCGFFLLPAWLWLYREPADHPWLTEAERRHIESGQSSEPPEPNTSFRWASLLRLPQSWSFIICRIFGDPLGYFYWFWIPSYLVSVKGLSLVTLSKWLWIPYVGHGLGTLVGGYFSGLLIKRGTPELLARKSSLLLAPLLTPAVLISLYATTTPVILWSVSMGTFAIGWWGVNYYAALMDTVPKRCVSSVTGLAGTVGALSSVPGMWLTGYAADHGIYRLVFATACVMLCLSVGAIWFLLRGPVNPRDVNKIQTA